LKSKSQVLQCCTRDARENSVKAVPDMMFYEKNLYKTFLNKFNKFIKFHRKNDFLSNKMVILGKWKLK
jgi:hypothetical protein